MSSGSIARLVGWIALGLSTLAAVAGVARAGDYRLFESGQVRPLALSPDGDRLYVVNTPDGRLEVLDLSKGHLVPRASVAVGLEPVAVAVRNSGEVWVVNHLSDSVSIVDVASDPPRVARTLLVGDEPKDVVFGGPDASRAFVSAAHRGQNSPYPLGEYATPGIGRADVWVFDTGALGDSLGGDPLTILQLFGDSPRALAASPDGSTVYASVFKSGNRTATASSLFVCQGGATAAPCTLAGVSYPGGLPAPNANQEGIAGPVAGLIVKFDPDAGEGGAWLDELGRDWSAAIRFELPDLDLFAIDALATPPVAGDSFAGIGTVLFDVAVNPVSGVVYVSNTEAVNEVRFEGPGVIASGAKPPGEPASVRGHLHEARITVVDAGAVEPRRLNTHISYGVSPVPAGVKQRSLASPLGMAVSSDGSRLHLAAFGSGVVAVIDTAELESGAFVPSEEAQIAVGGGPTGLVLDEARDRLYVMTRFDNSVVAVDLASREVVQRLPLHSPEPASVIEGRPFLYDARLTSSNGEASCGVCHVFGDTDELAWDLGNPDADVEPNPNPGGTDAFHPLKGPMSTQTLRGIDTHGPMHWRGDRTGGNADPPGDPLEEVLAFEAFNGAFGGLLGREEGPLTDPEMRAFADFALQIVLPPNPMRRLDNALREDEARGEDIFFVTSTFQTDFERQCNDCHLLDASQGAFGTNRSSGAGPMKIPHLRTVHRRVGMFGFPPHPFVSDRSRVPRGPQVRGYGYTHDGSVDNLFTFLSQLTFLLTEERARDLQSFLMVFDSNLAPVVGQQVTLGEGAGPEAEARVALLEERAASAFDTATECDLVAKGVLAGEARGFVRTASGLFRSDRAAEPLLDAATLRGAASAPGSRLTWTCVPPGSGVRTGIDRDRDGAFDRDELDASADPANPGSAPGACMDGIDNDGDGRTDHAEDPGCLLPGYPHENPQCDDGRDNDADGLADADDPQCEGRPWRNREHSGIALCGLGFELALVVPVLAWLRRLRRGGRPS